MPVGLGTAVGYLNLDVRGFAQGVDSAISDMNKLDGSFSTASKGLQTIGGMFEKTGMTLTAGFTAPLVGATAASVKFGAEFDKQMSNVKAVMGATTQEFEDMREAAISWGEKTVYTATEAGEALYYMGLAGWDSQEAIEGLGPVLNLAAAGDLNLGRTSDIVTDALTAFNLTAQDTTMFTNVLAATMSNSNTDVDMLGESFKYVAPVAGAFGYTIQDVALALGLFANNGVKSSQAGTGLRQALNALTNPSEKAAAEMERFGVSIFNADGSTKPFIQVMEELRETFGSVELNAEEVGKYIDELGVDLDTLEGQGAASSAIMEKFGHDLPVTDMDKLSGIVRIFGVRALPGMLSVINASEEDFYGLAEKINGADAAFVQFGDEVYTIEEALEKFGDRIYTDDSFEILGAAAGMASVQMDNLSGDWTKFTSALGTSQIIISDMAKGALRELVQKLTDIVTWFNNLDEAQREQITKWALVLASIGPILVIIGKLISGIGSLITTFNTLKGAFGFISIGFKHVGEAFTLAKAGFTGFASQTSLLGTILGSLSAPIIAIVAAVTALVAAFVNLWKNNEEFRNKIIEIWEGIKAKFEEAGQRIVDIFNELGFNFEDFEELMAVAIEGLKALWDGFCELLAPVFVGAFSIIGDVITGFIDMFVGVVEIIAGIVKGFKDGDWSMLWKGIGDVVETVVNSTINILDHLGEAVWNIFNTISGWLGIEWTVSWEEAKQAVYDWFISIVQWVTDLADKIVNFFSTIHQITVLTMTAVWDTIITIWNGIVTTITTVLQTIVSIVQNVWSFITTTITSFMQLIRDTITTVWNTIQTIIANVMDVIYNIIQSIWNMIKSFLEDTINSIKNHIINTWTTIKTLLSALMDAIKNMFDTTWNIIKAIITTITNAIYKVIDTVWNNIKSLLSVIMTFIQNMMDTVWNAIKNMITTVTNAIYTVINNVWTSIKNFLSATLTIIQNTMNTVWNAIQTMITTVVNAIKQTINDVFIAIKTIITDIINAIYTVLTNVWNSIKNTISDIVNGIKTTVINAFNNIKSSVTDTINSLYNTVSSVFNSIKTVMVDTISKAKDDVVAAMKSVYDGIIDVFSEVASTFGNIGRNIIQGIINGINSMTKGLYDSMKSILSGLIDNVKAALGIKSPSRVFREQVGKWLPPGIADGFVKAMPDAIKDMEDSLNDGIDSIETDEINADNINFEMQIDDFANAYKQVFEDLVIWFETMEDRMAVAIEGLTEYFKYLMYVRQILGSDDEFRTFVLGEDDNNKPNKPINPDTPVTPVGGGGDTYNFYSPKPIDEVQAARMLRNTKRDMAEGF